MAIPAYKKYQKGAEENVILSTLSQINKAFNACIIGTAPGTCAAAGGTINSTLNTRSGAAVTALVVGSGANCFNVIGTNLDGCISFNDDGLVTGETITPDAKANTAGACDTTTGTCAP